MDARLRVVTLLLASAFAACTAVGPTPPAVPRATPSATPAPVPSRIEGRGELPVAEGSPIAGMTLFVVRPDGTGRTELRPDLPSAPGGIPDWVD